MWPKVYCICLLTLHSLTLNSLSYAGGGRFIIGQEQDDLSASFNDIESFVGDITFVQVWNHVILGSDILAMFTFCDEFTGNVIAWPEFRFSLSGIVSILNSTFCAGTVVC